MSFPGKHIGCVALLAFALWASAAGAQDATPPAPPAGEPPPPEVISIGSVASRAGALEDQLRKVAADLGKATVEKQAQAKLEEITTFVEAARQEFDASLERISVVSELSALQARWGGFEQRAVEIEDALAERVGTLDAQLEQIQETSELWKRTATAASKASAPQAVRSRIAETRKRLRTTEAAITRHRNEALELQSSVAELLDAIHPAQERIRAAADTMAAGLLIRSDEPLWRSWPGWDRLSDESGAVADRIAGSLADLADYSQRKREALFLHALLILGMVWLLRRTRQFVDAQHAASGVDPGGALRHPTSAAILAGLLLTPILQPEGVGGIRLLTAIVALPLWYRVLSGMLPSALHGTLGGAALLSLIEIFRLGVVTSGFVGRWILFAELFAGAVGVWWLRRPARLTLIPARLHDSGWMSLLDGWLRLVLVFFSVGAVAVLVGYTSIGARLCMLAITGSFFGAGIMALVRILELVTEYILSASFFDSVYMIRDRRMAVASGLTKVFRSGGFGIWIYSVLSRSQLWEPLSGAAAAALSKPLGFGTAHFTLGSILAFILTLWLSWLLARFVSSALNEEVFPRLRMPQGVPFALSRFAHYGVLVIGFMIAMGTLGFSIDRVTLLLSALGVGIGFGLQTVVNNFVSGLILLFERPVRVGDRIQIGELLGVVTHIGIRASRIRTFDGSDVIMPNGDLIASPLINWTLSDSKRRIVLPVGVAYGTDPEKVLRILEQVARDNPDVLEDPAPEVLFRNFGDSSLDFELRAWTESVRGWYPVRSDLAVAINRAFAEADVQIPFPQRDLYLRNLDDVRDALNR